MTFINENEPIRDCLKRLEIPNELLDTFTNSLEEMGFVDEYLLATITEADLEHAGIPQPYLHHIFDWALSESFRSLVSDMMIEPLPQQGSPNPPTSAGHSLQQPPFDASVPCSTTPGVDSAGLSAADGLHDQLMELDLDFQASMARSSSDQDSVAPPVKKMKSPISAEDSFKDEQRKLNNPRRNQDFEDAALRVHSLRVQVRQLSNNPNNSLALPKDPPPKPECVETGLSKQDRTKMLRKLREDHKKTCHAWLKQEEQRLEQVLKDL